MCVYLNNHCTHIRHEIFTTYLMRISGKRIAVIVIMAILVSSVVAGAVSDFNRSTTTTNNQASLNARIDNVVDFCLKSLPVGTSPCDSQLGPVLNRICSAENTQQTLDACHDGKVTQYYKVRNNEIAKVNKSNSKPSKK
jgi:c-di-AMP phosphodiesterase-like protein